MQPQGQPPQGQPGMPQGMQQAPQGPQGPQMSGVPNMPNGQMPANPAAMAALAQAMQPQGDPNNQGNKTIQERIIETIDYADLPEDAKQQVLSQQLGIDSNMASPAQQNMNMKAMQLQHDQTKHDLVQSQAAHKALLDTHNALLTHQGQQFNQEQTLAQPAEAPSGQ
jgi:hypothetical protein